ncbi:MAG TPA: Mur ligase family protein [Polyangiaceae bacterium]|nr:Mur ligase family protein [Polyangiaceae bacterium]
MHIHVVAVSGTAMGSLAGLLRELGHDVSGSDVAFDPPVGPALAGWGVRCMTGFDPAHLVPRPDLVVVGNVCRRDNPEARAAIDGKLPYTHIAGALQEFVLSGTRPLVVAGTHGKTTTTSLAAWLLEGAGLEPGFLVGGIPANFERSFRAPKRRRLPTVGASPPSDRAPFVIEGDEYDTAFFEKTAKFLHYRAEVAIVTSVEHDHVDIYPTRESYEDAFRKFVAGLPENGLVVANAADETVVRIVTESARAPASFYALEGEDTHGVAPRWLAAPAVTDRTGTTFDLFAGGVLCGRYVVPLAGRHNVSNTVAALAATVEGYGVPLHLLARPLSAFRGVKRRQEVIGTPGGITVIDDFAHHPTAVRETLAALRARHANGALIAVFEPRSATACRAMHQAEYERSFDSADRVLFPPLGRSGLPESERLDLGRLSTALSARGRPAETFDGVDAIVARLKELAKPGDTIALLSNGAFGGIHEKVLTALAGKA